MSSIAAPINFCVDGLWNIFKAGGEAVAPMAFGAGGGWLLGFTPQMGALQGFTAGILCSYVIVPIAKYVRNNSGENANQFHANTCYLLSAAALVVEVVVPVLVVSNYGDQVLTKLASVLPSNISWLLGDSASRASYSVLRGIFSNIAPMATQVIIEVIRDENNRQRETLGRLKYQ